MMLVALMIAIMIHEVAHGLVALWCGDPTARDAGRLSLNPIRHVDPVGTIILPGLLFLSGSGVMFGWAKPVPIALWRTRNPRQALWLTAIAGPASNFLQIALASGALYLLMWLDIAAAPLYQFLMMACIINAMLIVFNLLPVPPLDGSRVVAAMLPRDIAAGYLSIERFGFVIIFVLLRMDALDGVLHVGIRALLWLFGLAWFIE
jgi:Zn-dependent protease